MTSVHAGITRSPRVLTADFLLFIFSFSKRKGFAFSPFWVNDGPDGLKRDFRYSPEAVTDDPMSKNARRSKSCGDRGYSVFFDVRDDLACVVRFMSGGGCC